MRRNMAIRRRFTEREKFDAGAAIVEILYDFGLYVVDLPDGVWEEISDGFIRRAVWIRDCWNVAAACKWLRTKLEAVRARAEAPEEDDEDETDSWPTGDDD
jgi:hypothetical protein